MTKTREAYEKMHLEFSRMHDEVARIAAEEFPAGTKVKWARGLNYLHGEVVRPGGFRAEVKTKSGTVHDVEHERLEFDA